MENSEIKLKQTIKSLRAEKKMLLDMKNSFEKNAELMERVETLYNDSMDNLKRTAKNQLEEIKREKQQLIERNSTLIAIIIGLSIMMFAIGSIIYFI